MDLPDSERQAGVDRLCGEDADLRREVQLLLKAHGRAGEFLRSPTLSSVVARAAAEAGPGGAEQPGRAELPGPIGPYIPLALIAEGGFGAVYKARQDEPVQRIVALKVIKAGMDTREVISRFESERQALAIMDHPHIARVLDAGATDQGRPYFVMEFVPGVQITEFCNQRSLNLRTRLALFIQVCHAVQHAHQKGVIHRDIKPGNILVADHDGISVPKVIDFGVAKATDPRLSQRPALTHEGVLIGTPEYMSPEQADIGQVDIDTRADVYSLGVVLYELLTGTLPFDPKSLRAKGYAEIQRIIRQVEPPRPSTAALANPNFTFDNAHSVRGDLDWIVMKCLEKDRARRYETASALARDIERYLKHEPVVARPPTMIYRLSRFARRNRAAFLAISGIALALTLGLAVSIAGFVIAVRARNTADRQRDVADQQRKLAQSAADRSEAMQRFLQDMLLSADPKNSGQRDMTVRQALDRAVARLDAGALNDQPDVAAAVRLTVSKTYAGLAQYAAAEKQAELALRSIDQRGGGGTLDYADALQQRGEVRQFVGHPAEAEADFRAALEILRARNAPTASIASCLSDLANALVSLKRSDEAESLQREAVEMARRPENANRPVLAEAVNNLGSLFLARQDWAASEPFFREAIEVNKRLSGRLHPNLATNLDNLAQALAGRGDLPGAEAAYRDALDIRRQLYGSDHPDVAVTLHNLAGLEFNRGDRQAAETALREALSIFQRTYTLAHADSLVVVDSLVSVLGSAGRLPECEQLLLQSVDAVRDADAIPPARKQNLAIRLVQLYQAWDKPEQAAQWESEARRFADASSPSTRPSSTPAEAADPSIAP